jgi:alkylation response protein AidB-like acyl-CoA dehydrogenase
MSPGGTDGCRRDGEEETQAGRRTAGAFAAAIASGRLDVPLPGSGATRERWAVFADLAGEDLSLARLGEGHADSVAILAELGEPPPDADDRWGVWAANPPGANVTASRQDGAWVLRGTKQYCSGARVCTHALVTAAADDGPRLFAVDVAGLEPVPGSWPATGMAGSDTLDVSFPGVPAEPVGPPGGYTDGRGSAMAAWAWRPAGTAEPELSAARCSTPRASATSACTRSRTWEPLTSGCARCGTRSARPRTRSTPTPRICADRGRRGPCGCVR